MVIWFGYIARLSPKGWVSTLRVTLPLFFRTWRRVSPRTSSGCRPWPGPDPCTSQSPAYSSSTGNNPTLFSIKQISIDYRCLPWPWIGEITRASICKPFKKLRNQSPPLAGRYDNPICVAGPTGYIGLRNRFLGSINFYKYGLCWFRFHPVWIIETSRRDVVKNNSPGSYSR